MLILESPYISTAEAFLSVRAMAAAEISPSPGVVYISPPRTLISQSPYILEVSVAPTNDFTTPLFILNVIAEIPLCRTPPFAVSRFEVNRVAPFTPQIVSGTVYDAGSADMSSGFAPSMFMASLPAHPV